MEAEALLARQFALRAGDLSAELRRLGVRVSPAQTATFVQALAALGLGSPEVALAAARATLTSTVGDEGALRLAFARVFGGPQPPFEPPPPKPPRTPPPAQAAWTEALRARVAGEPQPLSDRAGSASAQEALRQRRFEAMTDAELREAARIVAGLAWRLPQRRTRRREARGRGPVDLRATLRRARSTGGEPLALVRTRPRLRPRPLTLLLDVSGSMERYARVLVVLAHALAQTGAREERRRVEVFTFGTRLTRVTRALTARTPDAALAAVSRAVADWSGGTRIGASLRELQRDHAPALSGGALVLIVSDGLDTGDPALLSAELARLRRRAHRLIWLNPLADSRGYAPIQAGMRAALPHLDHFLAGGSIASLDGLVDLLNTLTPGR